MISDAASQEQEAVQVAEPNVLKTPSLPIPAEDPAARFRGRGTSFRAKLIGVDDDVPECRGDKMCQDSILKLKAIVKASGQHKQKIIINITLDGIKLIDLLSATVLYQHSVEKISFISRDQTDRRAFGYVYGLGDGKHAFFGIKTAKIAEHTVLALRDLFEVVYNMKKKEIEEAKKKAETTAEGTEPVYAVSTKAVNTGQQAVSEQNIFVMEQELESMQQMSDMDAFKSNWSENIPTSPDTPAEFGAGNLYSMIENPASSLNNQSTYSDDLAGFDMEALEPAADGGVKLTKAEILAGFSQGPLGNVMQQTSPFYNQQSQFGPQQSMVGASQQPAFGTIQQPNFGATQQPNFSATQQPNFSVTQQPGFSLPQQSGFGAATNPLGGQPMSMFSPGPRPVVPARTGAMRPTAPPTPAQTGASENPFGDAFGDASSGSSGLLAPTTPQSKPTNGSSEQDAIDPFANLLPGLGSVAPDKKNMFKNFQMAKPNLQGNKSEESMSSGFDNYFRKSVGGVPLDAGATSPPAFTLEQNKPTPAPRTTIQDNFNPTDSNTVLQSNDPFSGFGSNTFDQGINMGSQQSNNNNNNNNAQLLFG